MELTCLNCGRSEQEIPLVTLRYQSEVRYLCPQCFPMMIHQPQKLAGKLPGAENMRPAAHDD
jgi:hypothetical protein